jgi:hypothetical protein
MFAIRPGAWQQGRLPKRNCLFPYGPPNAIDDRHLRRNVVPVLLLGQSQAWGRRQDEALHGPPPTTSTRHPWGPLLSIGRVNLAR